MKKAINIILLILASAILITYITGYNYLFRAIRIKLSSNGKNFTIDDGKFFPSKIISKGNPKPWPLDINYNKQPLSSVLEKHLKNTETVSFLIIQHGKLLQEHYWEGYQRNTRTNSFSIAKGITVLLLGKAIDDGRIVRIDQPFSDFYKEFSNDPFGKNLTLQNLASMEAGLDWKEDYKNPFLPGAAAYYGYSLADVVFKIKFKEKPGERFEYQSSAIQLLGFALRRAVGMPLSFYASAKLWKPLGMEQNAEWTTDDLGVEKSFCCIHSTARDFAKIGFLLLNKGKFENNPLISEGFIHQMITPTEHSNGTYGLGVSINYDSKIPHYYLHGISGQYIIMVPEDDMIIVRLGNKADEEKDAKNRPKEVEFYVNEALKFVHKNQSTS